MEHEYFVYILECADGKYYTGITNDVTRRLHEHQEGINEFCWTYKRRPVDLVYSAYFGDVDEAIRWEKVVKRWRRAKKQALICGDYEKLPELAHTAVNWMLYPLIRQSRCNVMLSLSKHDIAA